MDNSYICTVLLITYNQENSIEKAIKSVLNQKTKYAYKIHIFDDCSTDSTRKIINQYALKYPNLIFPYLSECNRGSSNNFWAAYNSVDTKYCAILEGDDYWCCETKIEEQINALKKHPECASCAGNTVMLNIGDYSEAARDGELMVNVSLVNKQNIFTHEYLKQKYCGYINHLSSRMINFEHVNLKEIKNQESFCYDNAQFFYLLSKGPVYMVDKILSTRVITGKGIFSSANAYKKIRMLLNALVELNAQINYELEDIIFEHIQNYIGYYLYVANFNEKSKIRTNLTLFRNCLCISSFKSLKRYLLPGIIIDALDIPRDIYRCIREFRLKKRMEKQR